MPATSAVQPEINRIMDEQSQAWNRGDLEGFMAHYWQSDSLVFIGKSGPTYGWQKTLENYQKGYPNKEAMGQLQFTLLKTEVISHDALFVVGKWHLTRTIGDVGGHFSLVFRKINGQWKIVADHSS
ncbi:nuclear transport factor 2 family protein [Nibribacter koreensis]|uniref:Nuclear transport factor 2 family protein n=1 Tax=Nibribacter koreensis TaxID=1084519 RepID=A0ABP8F8C0_9BACT